MEEPLFPDKAEMVRSTIPLSEAAKAAVSQNMLPMRSVFSVRHVLLLLRGLILSNDNPFLPSQYQKEDVHLRLAMLVLLLGGFHRLARP